MKTTRFFAVALLAIILASLVGCASQKFEMIDRPIQVGDKEYTAMITERVNPWGTNAVSLHLAESEVEQPSCQPQMQYAPQAYAPPPPPVQYAPAPPPPPPPQVVVVCPPPVQYAPAPCYSRRRRTQVVNNNNQGSIGWANGAFQGSVGQAVAGVTSMGAAALIRPSKISVRGGGASASSSSSSAAAAASD